MKWLLNAVGGASGPPLCFQWRSALRPIITQWEKGSLIPRINTRVKNSFDLRVGNCDFRRKSCKNTCYNITYLLLRHYQYLNRDADGSNWSSQGSWWVLILLSGSGNTKGVFKGSKDRKLPPHLVLLIEVVSSIAKGLAGIGVMWNYSGHYSVLRVLLGL